MAVTFCIATTLDECLSSTRYVQFDDEIHLAIYNERYEIPTESSILYSLDPYGFEKLSDEKISHLKGVSFSLIKYFEDKKEIVGFLHSLVELCEMAIKENKNIIALGD